VVTVEDGVDLETVDFLVPPSGDRDTLDPLPGLDRLAVVQVLSAGTDWIEDHMPAGAVLCNARGARDGPVAEWVLGALLGASSGLLECARDRTWGSRELAALAGEQLARWCAGEELLNVVREPSSDRLH
jgi:phosphoglycerate dehydrogenase-like enzyme